MDRVYTGSLPFVRDPGGDDLPGPDGFDPVDFDALVSAEAEASEATGSGKPVFLLADSQLLFWVERGERFLSRVRRAIESDAPRAAYLGASNGDQPAFFELFTGAMETVGITDCRMIPSAPSAEELAFLEAADLVLLAGGDTERGWRAFEANGVREAVARRHAEGAVLIGISAGAVQLGLFGWPEGDASPEAAFPTFGIVPFAVGAHDEEADWESLRRIVASRGGAVTGVGLPRGGGVVYGPGHALEAVRHPAVEVALRGGVAALNLLIPASAHPPAA